MEDLENVERKVEDGAHDAAQYLALVRQLKLRRPDKVCKFGIALLNNPSRRASLGNQVWTVYEQVAVAAMDCYCLDIAKDCVQVLLAKFPDSFRVGRLEGMWLEAKGQFQESDKIYSSMLENQPLDPQIHKRRVAIAKAQGNISGAIDCLRKYLELFMADYEAWRELAEIYISLQRYSQAAFCYEELILMQTSNPLWHLKYAEVHYTMGGSESLKTAKKYYAAVIKLTNGKNLRALYGICLCGSAINQLKGREREEKEGSDLQSLASAAIIKEYKAKCPKKVLIVTSVLEKLKVSA